VVRPFYPRTLEKVVWSAEEVPFLRALHVLKDVAKALRYLHVLGFVHKNVKPGNVVVQELRGRRQEKALLVGMSFGKAPSLVSSPSAASAAKASAQRYKAPGSVFIILLFYYLPFIIFTAFF
jgi:serine/threonine protein kinase